MSIYFSDKVINRAKLNDVLSGGDGERKFELHELLAAQNEIMNEEKAENEWERRKPYWLRENERLGLRNTTDQVESSQNYV